MFLLSWLIFLGFQGQPQIPVDQALLERTRKAVFDEENATMEKRCPRSMVPTWQRLQKQTNPRKQTGAAVNFLLAYYNIDFDKNLNCLLLPYQDWIKHKTSEWHKGDYTVDDLPWLLESLYNKRHKTSVLTTLLALKADGGFADARAGSLYSIWKNEPYKLLRLSSSSQNRRDNLLNALWMESDGNGSVIRQKLMPYTQSPHLKVKRTAQIMAKLSHQWDK